MAFGEVAELAILLKLRDEITGPLKNVDRELSGLNSRTASVHGGVSKIGQGFGQMATAAVAAGAVAGVAVAGIGVAAVKSAADFQASMTLIQTQAGGTAQEVQSMTKGILDLTTQVGTSANDLAAGLYHIESAGLRGAQALDILKIAAEGARVGNADLESVTNALIASVNSGVKGTSDMAGAMGTLNAIVGAGNMRMQDLTDAFSTGILSTAKTFGISIQSVGAAIADMTNQGVPAIDAATRLRMTISLLGAPSSKAAKEFKSIGIAQLDLANAMRGPGGIADAVQMLASHMQKAGLIDKAGNVSSKGADLLSQAFGGGRSSSAIMTLVGSIAKLNAIQDQVNKGAGGFGDAWAKTQEDVNFRAQKLGVTLDTLKLRLGEALLPAAGNILDALATELAKPEVTQGVTAFGNAIASAFSPENIHAAFDFAGTILPEIAAGAQVVLGIAKQGFDIFNALPGPLKTVAIAALIGTRLPGAGLVMSGVSEVARSLLGGVGSRIPGVGGLAADIGGYGTPVRVTNWPAGFGTGIGGAGGAAGAAEAVGGLLAPGLAPLAAMIGGTVAMYALPILLSQNNTPAQAVTTSTGTFAQTGTTSVDFFQGLSPALAQAIKNQATQPGRDMDKALSAMAVSAEQHAARDDAALTAAFGKALRGWKPGEEWKALTDSTKFVATAERILSIYKTSSSPSEKSIEANLAYIKQNAAGWFPKGTKERAQLDSVIAQLETMDKTLKDPKHVMSGLQADLAKFTASAAPSLRSMERDQARGITLLAGLKKAGDTADANKMIPWLAAINASILQINPSQGLTPTGQPGYETHAGRDDTRYKPVTVKGSPNVSPSTGFNLSVTVHPSARETNSATNVSSRYGPNRTNSAPPIYRGTS